MKRIKVSLAVLAIVCAVASAFTTKTDYGYFRFSSGSYSSTKDASLTDLNIQSIGNCPDNSSNPICAGKFELDLDGVSRVGSVQQVYYKQ